MPSRVASSSSDRTRPVANSSNHARPRTTALISAGSRLEGWFCSVSPGNTTLVATPRRLKSTAVVNSIVLAPGSSDARDGTSHNEDKMGSGQLAADYHALEATSEPT